MPTVSLWVRPSFVHSLTPPARRPELTPWRSLPASFPKEFVVGDSRRAPPGTVGVNRTLALRRAFPGRAALDGRGATVRESDRSAEAGTRVTSFSTTVHDYLNSQLSQTAEDSR